MASKDRQSKKRCATSSRKTEPPESLVFFLERSLESRIILDELRKAGATVEPHRDHFEPDATDPTWLRAVGARNWIVLTRDERIRYRAPERIALIQSGVRAFVLVAGNLRGIEMASLLVKTLPAIQRFVEKHPAPFIAKVFKDSSVKLWLGPILDDESS